MPRIGGVGGYMKILEYEEYKDRVLVTVLYEDNTFATLNMLNTHNRDEILKDVYIISKDARNRQPFEGEIPADLETYHKPQSSPSFMRNVDFYNLTGEVYDQFGQLMDIQPSFSVEGTVVKIEGGKIVESEVDVDTSYTVVASVGDIEERQERTVYSPIPAVEPTGIEAQIEALKREIDILTGVVE